ncbi:MAG: prolyl oligopeptidase family serine peptidase [Planctomycetaceae bacterium]|nr:prolyl oligopeptidase family serine peptidase [Planctomycetaceae bacterium]
MDPHRRVEPWLLVHYQAGTSQDGLQYRLMQPLDLTSSARWPLVVYLHGSGERGDDNQVQLRDLPWQLAEPHWRNRFPCFVLAPQCPRNDHWTSHLERVSQLCNQLSRDYPIDRDRIYLTGYSMGGFGTWHLAAARPDQFAAVVPLAGGGDPQHAAELTSIPLWAFHGAHDKAVPVTESRQMIAAIEEAGGTPRYTEFSQAGHGITRRTYQAEHGVLEWMFQQSRAGARNVDPPPQPKH